MTMNSQHFLIFSTILLSTITLILFIKQKTKNKNRPPGPNKLPIIGNLHQLGFKPLRSFEHLANIFGPIMFLQLGSVPTLVISSPDVANEIFKDHDIAFSGRPVLYAAKRFTYNCSDMSFAPYGEYWREVRKIAVLELLTVKRVQSFSRVRKQEVDFMVKSIANSRDIVNLSDLTRLLTNSVVRRVAFGEKELENGKERRSFNEILEETQNLLGGYCLADFFPRMGWWNKFNGIEAKVEKNFKELDMYYDKRLEEHLDPKRDIHEHEDLVDVLLRLQKDPNQAIKLEMEHIKGLLTDMFIAGTDTSAAAIVWTMTELIKHPVFMKKVQNEIRELCNKKSRVEESDLSKLPYMKMVIREGLRLHPSVPLLPRETNEKSIIGKYKISAKTRVFVNTKLIARDPKYWENPNDFNPERFSDSLVDFRGQHFEYLPFGVGRRSCPGINFGMSMVELSLANMLYLFDWSLPQEMRVEDVDMEEAFGIAMHKKVPLCLVASPR